MRYVTPLRLIAVALVLAAVGGLFVLLTFSVPDSAVAAFFLIGNGILILAGIVGSLGWGSLIVELGVRSALRVREDRPAPSLELPTRLRA